MTSRFRCSQLNDLAKSTSDGEGDRLTTYRAVFNQFLFLLAGVDLQWEYLPAIGTQDFRLGYQIHGTYRAMFDLGTSAAAAVGAIFLKCSCKIRRPSVWVMVAQ